MVHSLVQKIQKGKSLTHHDMQNGEFCSDAMIELINAPSFKDQLPVSQYVGDGLFLFRDGKNLGFMFSINTRDIDSSDPNEVNNYLKDIIHIVNNAIDKEYENLWHSQYFISKSPDTDVAQKAKEYSKVDTPFSEEYFKELENHIQTLSHTKGAFIDKNTGIPFIMSKVTISACIWQEIVTKDITFENQSKVVINARDKLLSSLEQAKIGFSLCDAQCYINRIGAFFHDQNITYTPSLDKLLDSDLSKDTIGGKHVKIEIDSKGVYNFNDLTTTQINSPKYSIFLKIENINDSLIHTGHFTSELEDTTSILDRLPTGSIVSLTLMHAHEDLVREQLISIKNNLLGTDENIMLGKENIKKALAMIAGGTPFYRLAGGIYISSDNQETIHSLIRNTKAIISARGIRLLNSDENPNIDKDYISNLPFCFSYIQDRKIYNKNSLLMDADTIIKLLPFAGRSTGSGNLCNLKFNRGGEILSFDVLKDKIQNAYGLVIGSMGSGKSAFTIDFILSLLAVYNPRIFIIEKGDSFGLLTQYLDSFGLSTNQIRIKSGSDNISLTPFADAINLINKNTIYDAEGKEIERDLMSELVIIAKLMITGGEAKEEKTFERADQDTLATAITMAAKQTLSENREITRPSDVIDALLQISKNETLSTSEKERITKMIKSMNIFLQSDFSKKVFNSDDNLFPDTDITHLDLGILGDEANQDKLVVAMISLLTKINHIAERDQFSGRPIFVFWDEAHLGLKNSLLSPYLVSFNKMLRKLNTWLWLITQSIDDFADNSAQLLKVVEWFIGLSLGPSEVNDLAKHKELTKKQRKLLLSNTSCPKQYKEGTVISQNMTEIFRNIAMPISLALSQSEGDEKKHRADIMKKHDCSELEAALIIAKQIGKSRGAAHV